MGLLPPQWTSAISSDAELAVRGALLPVPNDPIEDVGRVFWVIKVGAAAYLRKTIEPADLLSTIG
jgi:hypothetical protein